MELVGYEDVEARSHEALASLVVHEEEKLSRKRGRKLKNKNDGVELC